MCVCLLELFSDGIFMGKCIEQERLHQRAEKTLFGKTPQAKERKEKQPHTHTLVFTHIPHTKLNVVTLVDLIELLLCKESLIKISSL